MRRRRAAKFAAISLGPRSVRLTRRISANPLSISAATTARAAAAGAEHHRRAGRRVPIRGAIRRFSRNPKASVLCASRLPSAVDDDRVDRADAAGQRIDPVDDRHRLLLVRDRQVAAAEAERRQRPQRRFQLSRLDRQRHVGAVDAMFVEPEIVQRRRARMRDRPAHDPGEPRPAGDPHRIDLIAGNAPRSRRNSSNSISGRPRIAK